MDISNLNSVTQQVSSLAKPDAGVGLQKLISGGKPLPSPGLDRPALSAEEKNGMLENKAKADAASSTLLPSREELGDIVAKANETPLARSSDLKFSIAEGSDINVVRIEDSETGELIRQIPSEAMVELARALDEQRQGMMFEERV